MCSNHWGASQNIWACFDEWFNHSSASSDHQKNEFNHMVLSQDNLWPAKPHNSIMCSITWVQVRTALACYTSTLNNCSLTLGASQNSSGLLHPSMNNVSITWLPVRTYVACLKHVFNHLRPRQNLCCPACIMCMEALGCESEQLWPATPHHGIMCSITQVASQYKSAAYTPHCIMCSITSGCVVRTALACYHLHIE
jgi:hypothetical protein